MDYKKYYKYHYNPEEGFDCPQYDLFISAFDGCDRTIIPYRKVIANEKIWMIFPQYNYGTERPVENVYFNEEKRESNYYREFMIKYVNNDLPSKSICIDSTGFLRSHLLFLLAFFCHAGVRKLDILYTEPIMYSKADDTTFSNNIECVRAVDGYTNTPDTSEELNDVLIVCSGYDEKLFSAVASYKSNCKYKYHIIGFPSLQPDMYQESMLRFYKIKESVGNSHRMFAPAFDPFVTAQTVDEIIKKIPNATNIYLSPLSTKPQTIGMGLYYLFNKNIKPVNVIFPFSMEYTSGHTKGIKRTWRYTLELPDWENN